MELLESFHKEQSEYHSLLEDQNLFCIEDLLSFECYPKKIHCVQFWQMPCYVLEIALRWKWLPSENKSTLFPNIAASTMKWTKKKRRRLRRFNLNHDGSFPLLKREFLLLKEGPSMQHEPATIERPCFSFNPNFSKFSHIYFSHVAQIYLVTILKSCRPLIRGNLHSNRILKLILLKKVFVKATMRMEWTLLGTYGQYLWRHISRLFFYTADLVMTRNDIFFIALFFHFWMGRSNSRKYLLN